MGRLALQLRETRVMMLRHFVVALAVLLTLIIFVSEAVRDAFDPRKNVA